MARRSRSSVRARATCGAAQAGNSVYNPVPAINRSFAVTKVSGDDHLCDAGEQGTRRFTGHGKRDRHVGVRGDVQHEHTGRLHGRWDEWPDDHVAWQGHVRGQSEPGRRHDLRTGAGRHPQLPRDLRGFVPYGIVWNDFNQLGTAILVIVGTILPVVGILRATDRCS